MPASITSATRVHSALSFIESLNQNDVYLFAGRVSPWDDENVPDSINASYSDFRDVKSNSVFMKKTSGDSCFLGLKRYDWLENTTYTPWDDSVDMTNFNNWLSSNQPFYVFVLDSSLGSILYNVYMCIDNNYGGPSTSKPEGQSTETVTYVDGYKWKFMFSVSDDLLDYLNDAFIPCPNEDADKTAAHIAVEDNSIPGSINRVKITASGSGYTTENTIVEIQGDGSGATATLGFNVSGEIEAVNITNIGSGYTYANVVVSGDGSGAELTAVISPNEGHGYDASMQLGASYVLYKGQFEDSETGKFPTQGAYRTVGLMINTKGLSGNLLTGDSYDLTDQLDMTNIIGSFLTSQRIIGNVSGASAVLYYISGSVFYITDRKGDFEASETVYLDTDPGVIATISAINNNTEVNKETGDIIYYENTQFVVRRSGQTESFIFSIEF